MPSTPQSHIFVALSLPELYPEPTALCVLTSAASRAEFWVSSSVLLILSTTSFVYKAQTGLQGGVW